MRILILQFVPDIRGKPVPRFDPQLGVLLRLLRKRGHDLSLVGLARLEIEQVKGALARDLPQLIYADIYPVCVDVARRTFEYIQQHEFLPIVAGGGYPTADPSGSLSLPGVQAVAIGEPDASLVTYLERIKDPAAGQVVPGVWLRDEQGLARPDLPPLVEDLDSLPFPERDLFRYGDFVAASGEIEIAAGRGCPQQCAYCVNDWLETIYADRGTWVRRRTPAHVLAEIDLLRKQYPAARRIRFLDHAFALDPAWLNDFLALYGQRCNLPFACHVRANSISAELAAALAAAGCAQATIEIISASAFVRNEVFDMDLTNEQIRAAFAALRNANIESRAIVYAGSPYDSEASLAELQQLLREIAPSFVDARPYYPFPATRARELARENGWLHPRGEEQYANDRCGIDMPACRPELIANFLRQLRGEFAATIGEPWWRRWSRPRRALHQLFRRRA